MTSGVMMRTTMLNATGMEVHVVIILELDGITIVQLVHVVIILELDGITIVQ